MRRSLPLHGPIISGTAETAWSRPATAFVARDPPCYIEFLEGDQVEIGRVLHERWILREFPEDYGPGVRGANSGIA